MSDDEQGHGGRALRVGKKRDGPNWFMLAGGAVAMAVSVVFGCRKVLGDGAKTIKEKPAQCTPSARTQAAAAAAAAHEQLEDAEADSVDTYDADILNTTPSYWENKPDSASASPSASPSPSPSESTGGLLNCKTKRPAATDPPPQAPSKFCRQLSQNSVCQSNQVPSVPSAVVDGHSTTTVVSPAALQAGLTARHEMVHRLRQQIRSRDAVIYDMQTQLSDQDQMIAMHRNHSVDLQECVQALSAKLYEANLEAQRLHRELLAQRAKPVAEVDEECIDIAVAEIKRQWVHPKDVEGLILEARKLNEEVERLEREKEAKDSFAQAKSRQCELLCKKVSNLATELEEVKTAAHGKQRLLEAKEHEHSKLANVLHDLQHKFETEPVPERGIECTRNNNNTSKLDRRTDARSSVQSGVKMNHDHVDCHASAPIDHEEVSATPKGVVGYGYCRRHSGSLRKSHGSVHGSNGDATVIQQAGSEDSVAKADSRCVSDAHTKRCRSPAADQDDYVYNIYETLDERMIQKFGYEVDQIASAISVTSKMVSEQMQAASRVLMDLQEHMIGSQTGAQIGPQASWKWPEFSQVFSCFSEGMSLDQKQAMRSEFELKVAEQQDVEAEMKTLSKHQAKLRELKSALAKLTARSNARSSDDDNSDPEMASSLSYIEQKLAIQEGITEEASLFIQQLSTLFPRSSSQTPPVQEIWKTVKEASANSTPGKHFVRFSDEKSRSTLRKLDGQNSSRILERQDSSSGSRHFSPNTNDTDRLIVTSSSPMKQLLDNPYQFQLGSSSSPTSRPRTSRTTLSAGGRTSARKSATTHHEIYTAGSKRHAHNCVGVGVGVCEYNSSPSNRASATFSSAASSGFSFGLSGRDRLLDKTATTKSQTLESEQLEAIVESSTAPAFDHGNRMSSPEPEPSAHLFTEQRFLAFDNGLESSVGNASFFKRFRSATSPDFSPVQSPGYSDQHYSRYGSPQSPCCRLTGPEDDFASSLRRSLFTRASTSSPLAATAKASTSRTGRDSDRDFQIKRPTEENGNSTQRNHNSNPDCSPWLNSTRDSAAARLGYLDARQPGSPVDSLRNFDTQSNQRNEGEDEDEDEGGLSHQSVRSRPTKLVDVRQRNSYNRELDSLCRSVSNLSLDTKESSESGTQVVDQPATYLPSSLLRRSNSSNRR